MALDHWESGERAPARTTTRLLELVAEIHGVHISDLTTAQIIEGFGRFPVAGYVWFQDDFGAPRYTPYYSPHMGNDLFARRGTPATAVANGEIVRMSDGPISGLAVWLEGDDGYRYFYGHFDAFAPGIRVGTRVRVGDILGVVGDTGSAKGTPPHIHFEIRPVGGETVSPRPFLDRWLDDAEAQLLARLGGPGASAHIGSARWSTLVDLLRTPAGIQPAFWPSALDPAGSTVGFADLALGSFAATLDRASLEEMHVTGASREWSESAALSSDPVARLLTLAGAMPYAAFEGR